MGRSGRPARGIVRLEGGFTLVELMVVVLIIGILVVVAVPVSASSQQRTELRTCFANIRMLEGGAAQYYAEQTDHGGAVLDTGNLGAVLTSQIVTGGTTYGPWLKVMPACPAAGLYTVGADGHTVNCTVHGHF